MGSRGAPIISDYGLPVTGGFAQANISRNNGFKNLVGKVGFDFGDNLVAKFNQQVILAFLQFFPECFLGFIPGSKRPLVKFLSGRAER